MALHEAPATFSRLRSRPRLALLAAPLILLGERAWARRWISDDGFVNLRVVSQIRAGHGPVFNAGERVEAVTSPLWLAILWVADALTPVRIEWTAAALGICLSVAGLGMAIAGSARLSRSDAPERLLVPAGAFAFVAVSAVWDFASAGLEGGLAFAWIGACCLALARWSDAGGRSSVRLASLCGLGPLIRPDFLTLSVCFLAVLWLGAGPVGWRRRFGVATAWIALPGAFQVFRMGYYGALIPNTGFAKEAGAASWRQGLTYAADFVGTYWLWVPLAALALGCVLPLMSRRSGPSVRGPIVVAGFVAGACLHALYVVRVGGDYMHARLLLPSFFAFLAPVAVVSLGRARVATLTAIAWAAVALAALRPAPGAVTAFRETIWDDRGFAVGTTGVENPMTAAQRLPDVAALDGLDPILYVGPAPVLAGGEPVVLVNGTPRPVVLAHAIGAVGYLVGPDTYVLDGLGLGDVFTARLELTGRGWPGHEKPLPDHYAIARLVASGAKYEGRVFAAPLLTEWRRWMSRTDQGGIEEAAEHALRRDSEVPLDERIDAARELLACDGVLELLAPSREALGVGRFMQNIVDAARLHSVRIPWDPEEALDRLC